MSLGETHAVKPIDIVNAIAGGGTILTFPALLLSICVSYVQVVPHV